MKHTFVIDENVFILAHVLQNEHGEPDLSSIQLIVAIRVNRHAIALDPDLWRRYCQKANWSLVSTAPSVIGLIRDAMSDSETCRFETNLPAIAKEDQVPADDVLIVRLAVLTRAILGTTDAQLKNALEAASIVADTGIRVLLPEAALPFAQEVGIP